MSVAEAKRLAALEAVARMLGRQVWELEMERAVPTDEVQQIVKDFARGPSQPSSIIPSKKEEPRPPKSDRGWVDPAPLVPWPGMWKREPKKG
jgi:hypothetical protein